MTWVDAVRTSGSWLEDDSPTDPVTVETVGWVVYADKTVVKVAAQQEEGGKCRCLNVIPMGCVKSLRELA